LKPALAFLILAAAAALEAGGDAIIRRGLHGESSWLRPGLIIAGGLVLTAYGVTVNLPPWDFGRLLGVYVALFFVVAQVINRVAFGIVPSAPVLLGGALILSGALVMTFWRA
jgi:drug/metabolite transporter superfamily protein YnfA